MYEITIKKSFSAAHILKEIGGKCEELHGHNFLVEVAVVGENLNAEGLLIDFRDLKRWTAEILDGLDHTYLNTLECFREMNPSSEAVARHIFDNLVEKAKAYPVSISQVTVWESENARVLYRRS